ncbi:MAG: threonine--tRNA ligase, partial [Candidatus Nomurabacteria bacterium]|nr:threonine--tRNA ligase [Candidatus Nomurabacteria bacterium]
GDIQNKEMWEEAGRLTEEALKEFGAKFVIGTGEASFYGPKIDVQIKNVNGKEDSIATAQVDFYSPNKFDLFFTNQKGEKEHPVIIHRAIMGSFDRFFAFLVEQTAGNFPLWLSPVQVIILPISEHQKEYADSIYKELKDADIRVELDDSNESLGKRIRNAKMSKVPYVIVIGDKERDASVITVEGRTEKLEGVTLESFMERIQKEIKERILN